MHRKFAISLLILLLVALMTACEEDNTDDGPPDPETPAEIAEVMLSAINDNDIEGASQYLCEKDIEILQENPPTDVYPEFSRVDCAGNESIVTCNYSIEIDGTTAESGLEAVFDVVEGGTKLCSVEAE
jgi:hypothetical protein